MKLLANEQQESYENAKICYICKEKVHNKHLKDKEYCKVRDHCHYAGKDSGTAHKIFDIEYSVLEKIPIVFHNRSNYGDHFIIKKLAEELEKNKTLGESYEKYLIFKFPTETKLRKLIKMEKKLPSSLSNLAKNLSEGVHKINCKYGHDDKNGNLVELNILRLLSFLKTLTMI